MVGELCKEWKDRFWEGKGFRHNMKCPTVLVRIGVLDSPKMGLRVWGDTPMATARSLALVV